MNFSKYEATGNDFILIDGTTSEPALTPESVAGLCRRRTGLGADGLILMLPSGSAEIRMRIFNADGSEAEMCGNGIRALHLFALNSSVTGSKELTVETAAGQRTVLDLGGNDRSRLFRVDMGKPTIGLARNGGSLGGRKTVLRINDQELVGTAVSVGNPHFVLPVDEVLDYPVSKVGPLVERHPLFPDRTNVEFVQVMGPRDIRVRVWERGVGETLACGSGACASLVALSERRLVESNATVSLPGGGLEVDYEGERVFLTGSARWVFDGVTESR